MTDVRIPGDALERAARNMESVLRLLEEGVGPPRLEELLGDLPDVRDAAESFESRWSDGRAQLRDEAKDIQAALDQVIEGFAATDTGLTADFPEV